MRALEAPIQFPSENFARGTGLTEVSVDPPSLSDSAVPQGPCFYLKCMSRRGCKPKWSIIESPPVAWGSLAAAFLVT